MNWIALKMLTGSPGKYIGIVFGVAVASLLISHQASVFCGLMRQTGGQIRDIQGANIWVMDPNVQFSDDIKPLSDSDLYRVRGVPGVAWAVRLYKGLARLRLEDGNFQQVILLGLDDATLVGAPPVMSSGDLRDLRKPDAVIMDLEGYQLLWPNEKEPQIGKRVEMNDHEAEIVGICKASRTFQTFPVVYTRYTQALNFVPKERKTLSFVLADPEEGQSVEDVCRRIEEQTGLRAVTGPQFEWITMWYFLRKTGIPFSFGITVSLGFIVGTVIAALMFYLFTIENLKQFAALKAMGAANSTMLTMILLQALLVSVIGFGLGIGVSSIFGTFAAKYNLRLAYYMPVEVFVGTAVAVVVISMISSVLSMVRVTVVDPTVVFQG
jgi:putative ABC transport system permease protein